jgi:predicted aspartyl protease
MPKRTPDGVVILLAVLMASAAKADDRCHILRSPPIPVAMIEREPIISAKINGADARFMVDTGSSVQVLFPSAAAEFKLHAKLQPGLYTLGVGGYDNPATATVKSFTFGSMEVPNVQFLVSSNDLSDTGIAGILGQNLFQLWDEEFDFANGVMRLVEPQHCGGKILAYWAENQTVSVVDLQATTKADTELIGGAAVNGHAIRVLFDTGSDTSGLSLEAARRIGITPDSPGVVVAGFARGLTQQAPVRIWIAPIAEFAIGSEKILHTRISIGNIHSRLDDPEEHYDMLLGADFFRAHHVYVANSQSKLYFTYSGGPVFNLNSSNKAPAASAPSGSGRKPSGTE